MKGRSLGAKVKGSSHAHDEGSECQQSMTSLPRSQGSQKFEFASELIICVNFTINFVQLTSPGIFIQTRFSIGAFRTPSGIRATS